WRNSLPARSIVSTRLGPFDSCSTGRPSSRERALRPGERGPRGEQRGTSMKRMVLAGVLAGAAVLVSEGGAGAAGVGPNGLGFSLGMRVSYWYDGGHGYPCLTGCYDPPHVGGAAPYLDAHPWAHAGPFGPASGYGDHHAGGYGHFGGHYAGAEYGSG